MLYDEFKSLGAIYVNLSDEGRISLAMKTMVALLLFMKIVG